MITGKDLYNVLSSMIPLYVAMILAYASVKWWKVFSPDQCSGINRFVALFAVPLLSFHFISSNNPYEMSYRFIVADTLQKIIVLVILLLWSKLTSRGSLEWSITLFSLLTLPNTLVMGIPLLVGMYGDFSAALMVQIVVLQCIIWYTLLLFLFEYRGAKLLILDQFPGGTTALIESVTVDSNVLSFDGREVLETESEVDENGKIHVKVSKSTSIRSGDFLSNSHDNTSSTPSNMSNVELYSLPSVKGVPSLNEIDGFYSFRRGNSMCFWSNNNGSLRSSSVRNLMFNEEKESGGGIDRASSTGSRRFVGVQDGGYRVSSSAAIFSPAVGAISTVIEKKNKNKKKGDTGEKDVHVVIRKKSNSFEIEGINGSVDDSHGVNVNTQDYDDYKMDEPNLDTESPDHEKEIEGQMLSKHCSRSITITEAKPETAAQYEPKPSAMLPAGVMTRLVLIMIWRKLIRNPNTYSSLIGLAWSLISFRWHVEMPIIVANSIKILSNAGLGMAMFSLGLFMALQPSIIAGGNKMAAYAAVARFIVGPAIMAAVSAAIGLKGTLFKIAIVQATLPQGIVPFVFAKEYNVYPQILSTAVIFGMLIALPITLVYYIILGLIK